MFTVSIWIPSCVLASHLIIKQPICPTITSMDSIGGGKTIDVLSTPKAYIAPQALCKLAGRESVSQLVLGWFLYSLQWVCILFLNLFHSFPYSVLEDIDQGNPVHAVHRSKLCRTHSILGTCFEDINKRYFTGWWLSLDYYCMFRVW